jgi:hypothetical protein
MTDLILIKPEDIQKGGSYRFSDQIINGFRKDDELFVVGMGNAISLACAAVQRATQLSKGKISEIALDYIGSSKLGIAGVFFVLDKNSKKDLVSEGKLLEKGMKLTFDRDGQLLVVSNTLSPERAIPLALSRIADSDCLKISASGTAINRQVSIALELAKGNIANDDLGIILTTLFTTQFEINEKKIPETVMEIFIKKGCKTAYSKKHEQIVKMLTGQ